MPCLHKQLGSDSDPSCGRHTGEARSHVFIKNIVAVLVNQTKHPQQDKGVRIFSLQLPVFAEGLERMAITLVS